MVRFEIWIRHKFEAHQLIRSQDDETFLLRISISDEVITKIRTSVMLDGEKTDEAQRCWRMCVAAESRRYSNAASLESTL